MGGTTWFVVSANAGGYNLYFIDKNTGYVVGGSGTIMKTTNGGTSWISQPDSVLTRNALSSVFLTSIDTAYAVGQQGVIIKTVNRGVTWFTQNSGTSNNLNTIFFPDNNIGYAVGDYGIVLRTTDGGTNWITQYTDSNKFTGPTQNSPTNRYFYE